MRDNSYPTINVLTKINKFQKYLKGWKHPAPLFVYGLINDIVDDFKLVITPCVFNGKHAELKNIQEYLLEPLLQADKLTYNDFIKFHQDLKQFSLYQENITASRSKNNFFEFKVKTWHKVLAILFIFSITFAVAYLLDTTSPQGAFGIAVVAAGIATPLILFKLRK